MLFRAIVSSFLLIYPENYNMFYFFQGAKQLKWEMERDSWIKGKNKTFKNRKQGAKRKTAFKSGQKNIKKKK